MNSLGMGQTSRVQIWFPANSTCCFRRLAGLFTLLVVAPILAYCQSSSPCDVNKDGSTNVVDVQVAINNYLSCSTTSYQTFVSQVINGALGASCPVITGLHTVAVNWVASTTSGVTYNVYRATTPGGYNYSTPLNAAPISGTSFTDCSVALSQTYYYVIRAVGSDGSQSVDSNVTTVTVPSS